MPSTTSSWEQPGNRLGSALYVVVIVALSLIAATGLHGWRQAGFLLLAALACLAALDRVRRPYVLVLVAWATTLISTQVLLIPALFNLGVRRRDRFGLLTLALTLILLGLVAPRGERLVSVDGVDLDAWTGLGSWVLNGFVVVIVPFLIGTAVAARRALTDSYRTRAEHAESERSARAAEAVLLERARIAREAHDVLGHKLSLLTLQAGGLELNATAGPQVIAEQAQLIRRSARSALHDLSLIIGSLESPDALDTVTADRPMAPQGVKGIERLVTESRASGAHVELDVDGLESPELWRDDLARAAYRVVQECLTNAHRHASGAPVIVRLAGRPGTSLDIEIRNAMTAPASQRQRSRGQPARGGMGLPGLHERARIAGGSLRVIDDDRVFAVRAELPWPEPDDEMDEGTGTTP